MGRTRSIRNESQRSVQRGVENAFSKLFLLEASVCMCFFFIKHILDLTLFLKGNGAKTHFGWTLVVIGIEKKKKTLPCKKPVRYKMGEQAS